MFRSASSWMVSHQTAASTPMTPSKSTSGTASGNSQLTVSAAGAGDFEG